jgi:hypothetical protein
MEVEDSCTMVEEVLSQKGMVLLSAACKCTMVGPRQGIDSACSDVLELFTRDLRMTTVGCFRQAQICNNSIVDARLGPRYATTWTSWQ